MSDWEPLSTPRGMCREARDLVRELVREGGWEMRRGKRHLMVRLAGGGITTIPGSPSDWRSLKNTRADLDRIRRLALDTKSCNT